jgi:hypothetical protein
MVGEVVAVRAGLPPDDFSARVLAGAVIGAAIAAVPRGMTAFDRGDFDRLDDALMLLQAGLPLGSRPASG